MYNQTCTPLFALLALTPIWWTQEILHSWHTNPKIFNSISCNFKQCNTDWTQSQNIKCENCIAIKPLNLTKVFYVFEETITWMKSLCHTVMYEIHVWISLPAFFSDYPEFKFRLTSGDKWHFLFCYCSPASSLQLWKMVLEAVFLRPESPIQISALLLKIILS